MSAPAESDEEKGEAPWTAAALLALWRASPAGVVHQNTLRKLNISDRAKAVRHS
jgi:hypothetical protein